MTAAAGALEASVLRADDAAALRAALGERVAFDAPLGPYTSWKIGGPADALAHVETTGELAEILRLVHRRRLPWFVLGSGSNLLIGDGGIRGIVVRLGGAFAELAFEDDPSAVVVRAGRVGALAPVDGAGRDARRGRGGTASPASRGASAARCG